ncbi:hypothetical protein ACQCN2_01790 [Brevibacillus ginsengisoli]|uniref:hypothetical protein n=1 Tax=Brevibacillus ginsengisoli TaxID=363854 RepID=UPI003CEC7A75
MKKIIWGLFGALCIVACIWYLTSSSISFERISPYKTFFSGGGMELKPGINVFTADTHRRGNVHQIIFVGYKPSENIRVIAKQGIVHVYYDEDQSQETSSQCREAISFANEVDQKNIRFYINNFEEQPVNTGWATE